MFIFISSHDGSEHCVGGVYWITPTTDGETDILDDLQALGPILDYIKDQFPQGWRIEGGKLVAEKVIVACSVKGCVNTSEYGPVHPIGPNGDHICSTCMNMLKSGKNVCTVYKDIGGWHADVLRTPYTSRGRIINA